jgi:CRP-like cAMP-binding protein
MRSTRYAALRAVRELASSSDQDIWSLLSSADEIRLPAGAGVAEAGRYCNQFVVVVEGTLWVMSNGPTQRLGRGDNVGWTAMWDRSFNEATVVAESDVRLLVIGHAQFRAFKAVAARPRLESWTSPPARIPEWEQVS